MACCCGCIICALGIITLSSLLFKLGTIIFQQFIQKPTDLKKFGAKEGSWALITGASDGKYMLYYNLKNENIIYTIFFIKKKKYSNK